MMIKSDILTEHCQFLLHLSWVMCFSVIHFSSKYLCNNIAISSHILPIYLQGGFLGQFMCDLTACHINCSAYAIITQKFYVIEWCFQCLFIWFMKDLTFGIFTIGYDLSPYLFLNVVWLGTTYKPVLNNFLLWSLTNFLTLELVLCGVQSLVVRGPVICEHRFRNNCPIDLTLFS